MDNQIISRWAKGYNRQSARHLEGVSTVRNAYSDFWKNIKFRKGWDAPLFSEEEVDHLLQKAAEITSLIRGYLDEMDPSFKMRVQGGSSCEYLWEVDFHPPNEPTRFVRELVHATLKDAKGYVEGLTEKQVNIFVDEYFQSMKDEEGGAPAWTPVQIHEAFTQLQTQLQSMSFENTDFTETQLRHLKKATQHLVLANRHFISSVVAECDGKEEEKVDEGVKLSVSQTDFDLDKEIELELGEEQQDEPKEEKKEDEEMPEPEEEKKEDMEVEEEQKEKVEEKKEVDDFDAMRTSVTGMKVIKVQEDVDNLRPKIKSLASDYDTLEKQIEESDRPSDHKVQTKALTKKCLEFSERLMQSLLKLDEIQGGSQESRAKRKEQARTINALMDQMDSLKDRVRKLQGLVEDDEEKQEREKREKEEAERAIAQKEEMEKREEERRLKVEREREEKELRESWAELKLDPQMRVISQPHKYVITGNIPGMDQKDIGIEVVDQGAALQISGVRLPSSEEMKQMKRRLGAYEYPKEHEKELLLRLGAGRFGRFCEKYSLNNCDASNIEASYERGVLRVFVPKVQMRRRPQQRHQQRGAFPGFYSDRDAWW